VYPERIPRVGVIVGNSEHMAGGQRRGEVIENNRARELNIVCPT
jgi:hypothetical protein